MDGGGRTASPSYLAVDEVTATGSDCMKRSMPPIRQATSRYAPGDLPDGAHHGYGPIHVGCHESVPVERRTGVRPLPVAADH